MSPAQRRLTGSGSAGDDPRGVCCEIAQEMGDRGRSGGVLGSRLRVGFSVVWLSCEAASASSPGATDGATDEILGRDRYFPVLESASSGLTIFAWSFEGLYDHAWMIKNDLPPGTNKVRYGYVQRASENAVVGVPVVGAPAARFVETGRSARNSETRQLFVRQVRGRRVSTSYAI